MSEPTTDDLYVAAIASPEPFPVRALLAQLDIDGNGHEIAPAHEQPRLFEPAPRQIRGQTLIPLDKASEAKL